MSSIHEGWRLDSQRVAQTEDDGLVWPEMHNHLRTVIVAPMTTGSRPAAFRVPITFKGNTGLILLDQIRTLGKVRLVRREGAVHGATLRRVLSILQMMVASA